MTAETTFKRRMLLAAIVAFFAVGVALLRVSPGDASPGTVVSSTGASASASQAFSTTVQVSLAAGDTVNAFDVTLSFNASAINVVSTELANGWVALPSESPDNTAGTVRVAGLQLGTGCTSASPCALFTVNWQAVAGGGGGVAFSNVELAGSNAGTPGTITGVATSPGQVTVTGASQPSEPSPSATATNTTPANTATSVPTSAPTTVPATAVPTSPASPTVIVPGGATIVPTAPAASPTVAPPTVAATATATATIPPASSFDPSELDDDDDAGGAAPTTTVPLPPLAGGSASLAGASGLETTQVLGQLFIVLSLVLGVWFLVSGQQRHVSNGTPAVNTGREGISSSEAQAVSQFLNLAETLGRSEVPPESDSRSTEGVDRSV